jgi:hypothetical protein
LSEALGLSPEEVEKMWDLLAANQLNAMGAVPIMNGRVDTDAIRESSLSRIEAQRTLNESVASLLGPDRMDRWKEYQETLPSRQQTVQLGRILQSSGQALSDQQAAALADTIIAEQMGLRDGLARGGGGSMDPGQAQEERFRLQAESNRRIVEGASSYLNTNQVAALRAALDERLGRSRSAISTLQRSMSEPPQQPANAFH